VVSGSPAAGIGLTAGDVITAVDGDAVSSASGLSELIAAHHPGDSVTVTWTDSSGSQKSASVTLATGPAK
jgi:S1-C subfamily serine protease